MIRLVEGDARDMLPEVAEGCDLAYLDPPWPHARVPILGAGEGPALTAAVIARLPESVVRVALHVGCDTDPRDLLAAVPPRWPFLRVCWLRFARPSYKGRILNGAEVAYVFGRPPPHVKAATSCPARRASRAKRVRRRTSPGARILTTRARGATNTRGGFCTGFASAASWIRSRAPRRR